MWVDVGGVCVERGGTDGGGRWWVGGGGKCASAVLSGSCECCAFFDLRAACLLMVGLLDMALLACADVAHCQAGHELLGLSWPV